MRMRLAVVPPNALAAVVRLTRDLRVSVEAGDMDGVDAATKNLLAVTAETRWVEITEEEWRGFLAEVRGRDAAFQSGYIIPGTFCTKFFPEASAETMVLQLPCGYPEVDDV